MSKRKTRSDPKEERELRNEAERLALLPKALQARVIVLHRKVASNPALPERERKAGMAHAEALERYLRELSRRSKRKTK
jgi:hypothetical protein